ncbi:MAG: hypothetical protein LC637_06835, partial [Xanthomonadaceae bacterium]|nr:hypothetical protein [Xanthomonadaceae bacterium]
GLPAGFSAADVTDAQTVTELFGWNTTQRKPACVYSIAGTVPATSASDACTLTPGQPYQFTGMAYDSHGNPVQERVMASGQQSGERVTDIGYTGDGYFVVSTTNPERQTATMLTEPREGNVTRLIGIDGQAVRMAYDVFGREIETWFPVNAGNDTLMPTPGSHYAPRSSTRYQWTGGCPGTNCGDGGKVYTVSNITDGSPIVVETFDRLNRVVTRRTNGLSGLIHEQMAYTARGQVKSASEPGFAENPSTRLLTQFSYDPLGRQTSKTEPRGDTFSATRNTYYSYSGLETTIRVTTQFSAPTGTCAVLPNTPLDDEFCVKRTIAGDGTLIRTTDAHGHATRFWANARGQMALIENSQGDLSAARYNEFDQRTALSDPDMGSWTFAYTGAGELIGQIDAKGQTFDFEYDPLGRLTTRLADGDTGVIVDEWDYDQPAAGLLERSRRRIDGQPVFERTFAYDDQLRSRGQTTFLDPEPQMPGVEWIGFEQTWQSDPYFGRVFSRTDPEGRFRAEYRYSINGYQTEVRDAAANQLLKQVTEHSPRGQLEQAGFGNGIAETRRYNDRTGQVTSIAIDNGAVADLSYGYDAFGNLTGQANGKTLITESFTYDRLHRLIERSDDGPGEFRQASYRYDALGNITRKSDYAGTYRYGQQNAALPAGCMAAGINPGRSPALRNPPDLRLRPGPATLRPAGRRPDHDLPRPWL